MWLGDCPAAHSRKKTATYQALTSADNTAGQSNCKIAKSILDSNRQKEQKENTEQEGNIHMMLFAKDVASLAAIAMFIASFSLILNSI